MESDGETGVVGSGIGRVELSICKETEKPKEENIKGGYQVRLLRARDERIIWMRIWIFNPNLEYSTILEPEYYLKIWIFFLVSWIFETYFSSLIWI